MRIGYTKVSLYGESLDIQLVKLKEAGCKKIFIEKFMGAKGQRKEFKAMLDFTREGYQVVVARLDRLSRIPIELQNTSKTLKNGIINLQVLEQYIDTSAPSGKLLFNQIGTVEEFAREMINQRSAESRKASIKRDVKFGAKRKISKEDIQSRKNLIVIGESKANSAKIYNIESSICYRVLQEDNEGITHV